MSKSDSYLLRAMGNIVEELEENHSSEKLFNVVDSFLYAGVEAVLESTTLVEECLSVYFSTYTRKSIHNNLTPEKGEKLLYKFYMADDTSKKLRYLKEMKLNRDLLLLPLTIMADCCDAYCKGVVEGHAGLEQIRSALKTRDVFSDLSLHMVRAKGSVESYLRARELISQKYYRLVVKEIGKLYPAVKDGKIRVSLNDMAVEYNLAILKAFAKFDITSGPFTSYLKSSWFKHARSVSLMTDEIGISYTIPNNIKMKVAKGEEVLNNFSVDISTLEDVLDQGNVIQYRQHSDDDAIRRIVEMYDLKGLYRLLNDIEIS